MDANDVLSSFEHNVIPGLLYEIGLPFMLLASLSGQGRNNFETALTRNGLPAEDFFTEFDNILDEIIEPLFKAAQIENPFRPEDFQAEAFCSDKYAALKISFPYPARDRLCYCSYLFSDRTGKKLAYFTLEKNTYDGEEKAMLCSWNGYGSHTNYGYCPIDHDTAFKKCIKHFLG